MVLNRKLFKIQLSQHFNVKAPVPPKYNGHLIYKCTYPKIDCNKSYIGQKDVF